ncbi:hypothetical protein GTW59_02265, partial [Streptomyces sp. SID89]|nr:hypothetical protein [Streptomyces sp. SID89]
MSKKPAEPAKPGADAAKDPSAQDAAVPEGPGPKAMQAGEPAVEQERRRSAAAASEAAASGAGGGSAPS